MYIAIMYDQEVDVGTEIEMTGAQGFKFAVTGIDPTRKAFDVVWSSGSNKGEKDSIPFAVFGRDVVKLKEIPDDNNPNSAFMRKKYAS